MARRQPRLIDWGNRDEHASLFRPSTGRHSPIESKAMVVRADGEQVVFVSLDFVGVEKRIVADLAERLSQHGIQERQLVVGATHTHSGPGTISRRLSLSLVAVDRFRKENYAHVLDKIVESVELALSRMQPVDLVTGHFDTEGLQRNKFRFIGEGHFDRRARFLLARIPGTDKLVGGILNYALHGNGMPVADLRFSSDTPGSIANRVEQLIERHNDDTDVDPVVLYFNGAEGDVGNRERSEAAVEADGMSFADQAQAAGVLTSLIKIESNVSVVRKEVWLGLPGYSLRNCFGSPEGKPGLDLRAPMWLMQQRTFVSFVSIGNVHMLTWPGEPSVQVGYDTQSAAAEAGFDDSWILGLTNDYQAYFTTRDEYYEGAYDSCSSLFRWNGTKRIQSALTDLMAGE